MCNAAPLRTRNIGTLNRSCPCTVVYLLFSHEVRPNDTGRVRLDLLSSSKEAVFNSSPLARLDLSAALGLCVTTRCDCLLLMSRLLQWWQRGFEISFTFEVTRFINAPAAVQGIIMSGNCTVHSEVHVLTVARRKSEVRQNILLGTETQVGCSCGRGGL